MNENRTISPRPGFWLLIGLIALCAAGKPILYDTIDPDCFWHLRVAAQLHRDGIGPIVDDLSFASSKQPWTPYSWLAELGMKALWDHGGFQAAVGASAIMQGLIVLLLAMCCLEAQQREGRQPRYLAAAFSTALGLFLILPYLSFRPVTAGFVLLFASAWLVLREQRLNERSRAVWFIVPITVWLTNIHLFSFFIPAMFVAMGLGAILETNPRSLRRNSLLAITTAIACLATPMLPGLIKTILFYSARDKMVTGPFIAEMQSFARGPLGWVSAGIVLMMWGCIGRQYRRIGTGHLICAVAATLLMLKLGRFAPLFGLAGCPAFAATVPSLKDRLLTKPAVLALLGCIVTIGSARVTLSIPGRQMELSAWVNRHGPDTPGYPCAAADYLDQSVAHSTGRLINEFSWGGYLAWRLDGKFQVLMDGRTQVYPQSLWQATYLGTAADRQKFLSTVQADAALIPVEKSWFGDSLKKLGWTRVYHDDRAEVLLPPAAMARLE